MSSRRVVITGIGLVTPLGTDVNSSWNGLISGRSGIKPITQFNTDTFACKIAGTIDDFTPEKYIDPRDLKKMDLFIQYGIAAATEAIEDSGWKATDELSADRTKIESLKANNSKDFLKLEMCF